MSKLVIVESPTKARKIGKFLGSGYEVISSRGHIFDLPKSDLGVDVEKDYRPDYEVVKGKKKVVKEIRQQSEAAEEIYLAPDPDREGEAIAWHVAAAIVNKSPMDKFKQDRFKRVVFHEITKGAVESSFASPRELDQDLVDAQKARRVLDRLVGYKLSPLLWKKIRYGLSAGRVQSVGVRLIVEREKERDRFEESEFYRLWAELGLEGLDDAELVSCEGQDIQRKETIQLFAGNYTYSYTTLQSIEEVEKLLKKIDGGSLKVEEATRREIKQKAKPPFTTASLQREAAGKLNFTSRRTMRAAQQLYEDGYITYHRTDSTNLADQFIEGARQYIQKEYGDQFLPKSANKYQTKSRTAQEAHEAIRPTELGDFDKVRLEVKKNLGVDESRLFALIWRRAVSSQAAPAVYDHLNLELSKGEFIFKTSGSILKFPGWKRVYETGTGRDRPTDLPKIEKGAQLEVKGARYSEHTTTPPPRYSEASLIKELEKHEIGRPSTYATIVSTIQNRGYVGIEDKYFYPKDTGIVVSDLLAEHFSEIVDLEFTAQMEEDLDAIARGEKEWVKLIDEFYKPFAERLEKKFEEIDKTEVVTMKETGRECPECDGELVVKLGKYGKFISCSNYPDCDYSESLDDVHTPEDEGEVDESQLEGECPECGGELELKQGRYGRFIACSNYPDCDFTKNYLEKIGMDCPDCQEGEVVIKRTRKGRVFYGCSRYPKCEYASWDDPRAD